MAYVQTPTRCVIGAEIETAIGMPIVTGRAAHYQQTFARPKGSGDGSGPPRQAASGWKLVGLEHVEAVNAVRLPIVWDEQDIDVEWQTADAYGRPSTSTAMVLCRPTRSQAKRINEFCYVRVNADAQFHVATRTDWPPTPIRIEFRRTAPAPLLTHPQVLRVVWASNTSGHKLQLIYPREHAWTSLEKSRRLTLVHGPYPTANPWTWDDDDELDTFESPYTKSPQPGGPEWIEVEFVGGHGRDRAGKHIPLRMLVRVNDSEESWVYDLEAKGGIGTIPTGQLMVAGVGGSYTVQCKRGRYNGVVLPMPAVGDMPAGNYVVGIAEGEPIDVPSDVTLAATVKCRYWKPYSWPLSSPPQTVGEVVKSCVTDAVAHTATTMVSVCRPVGAADYLTPWLFGAEQQHPVSFSAIPAPSGPYDSMCDDVLLGSDIVSCEISYKGWPMRGITARIGVRNWGLDGSGNVVSRGYDRIYGARRVVVQLGQYWGSTPAEMKTVFIGYLSSRPVKLDLNGTLGEQTIEFSLSSRSMLYADSKPMFGLGSFSGITFSEAVSRILNNAGIQDSDITIHSGLSGKEVPSCGPQGGGLEFEPGEDAFKALDEICKLSGAIWGETHLGGFVFYPSRYRNPNILTLSPDNIDIGSFVIEPESAMDYGESKSAAYGQGYDPSAGKTAETVFVDTAAVQDVTSQMFIGHDLWVVESDEETPTPETPALWRLLTGKRAKISCSWRMVGSELLPGQYVQINVPQSGLAAGTVLMLTGKSTKATCGQEGDGQWWDTLTAEIMLEA